MIRESRSGNGWLAGMDGMRCGGYRELVCREEACGGEGGRGKQGKQGEGGRGVGGGKSPVKPPVKLLRQIDGGWVDGSDASVLYQYQHQYLPPHPSTTTTRTHARTHNATRAQRKNYPRTETTQRLHLLRRTHLQAETGRRKDPRVGRGGLVVRQLWQGRQPALEAGESTGETGLGRGGQEEGAGGECGGVVTALSGVARRAVSRVQVQTQSEAFAVQEGKGRRSSVVQCPPSPVSVGGEAVGPARDGARGETPPSPPLSPYGAFPVALQQPSWPAAPAGDSIHTPHSYLPPALFSPTWSLENAAFDMALQDASLFTALWPGVNLFQPYAYGPDVAAGYPVDTQQSYSTLGC
ncbi:uncharacterized protein L203_106322 [Cryptococcus depauperatus CBS 7841]|uniref:Uncharacterized protein n=1 Tax=Cryptococcus depauperatus CBS 7841 TaxID=1295531 RepID=A0AAJ8M3C0_9TREE